MKVHFFCSIFSVLLCSLSVQANTFEALPEHEFLNRSNVGSFKFENSDKGCQILIHIDYNTKKPKYIVPITSNEECQRLRNGIGNDFWYGNEFVFNTKTKTLEAIVDRHHQLILDLRNNFEELKTLCSHHILSAIKNTPRTLAITIHQAIQIKAGQREMNYGQCKIIFRGPQKEDRIYQPGQLNTQFKAIRIGHLYNFIFSANTDPIIDQIRCTTNYKETKGHDVEQFLNNAFNGILSSDMSKNQQCYVSPKKAIEITLPIKKEESLNKIQTTKGIQNSARIPGKIHNQLQDKGKTETGLNLAK